MSDPPRSANPLSGFTRLADSIYLYTPPQPDASQRNHGPSHDPPSLIVLAGWMAAAPRHVAKYATAYTQLYPTARILLIACSLPDVIYRSAAVQQRRLAPAVAELRREAAASPRPRILVHLFSNGGARMACMLARAFRAAAGARVPAAAMVLDSSPGRATYSRAVAATVAGLPRGIVVRFLGGMLVRAVAAVLFVWHWVSGTENVVDETRRALVDDELLDARMRRLYLYSKADKMVWWKDVEDHADEAEAKGCPVDRVRFENSAHAGHVLEDKERYWAAVGKTWEKALDNSNRENSGDMIAKTL